MSVELEFAVQNLLKIPGYTYCLTCLATSTPQWRPCYWKDRQYDDIIHKGLLCNACGLRWIHRRHCCKSCGFNMAKENGMFYCRICSERK